MSLRDMQKILFRIKTNWKIQFIFYDQEFYFSILTQESLITEHLLSKGSFILNMLYRNGILLFYI